MPKSKSVFNGGAIWDHPNQRWFLMEVQLGIAQIKVVFNGGAIGDRPNQNPFLMEVQLGIARIKGGF
jgi:hypothetical protein